MDIAQVRNSKNMAQLAQKKRKQGSRNLATEKKLREKFGEKFESAQVKNKEVQEKAKISEAAKKKLMVIGDEKKPEHLQNDPKNPVTKEKLKGLIQNNGFSFNPKEREVLNKILAQG
ncbi:hypothetical protein N9N67_03730 [Bacteriovoracaceae bacterium]|nr:hypothetical protein [Bacteriovoracaceae bacterium]